MIRHNDITDEFTVILIAIVIQTINDGDNEGWACKNVYPIVDIACNIEDRTLDAIVFCHFHTLTLAALESAGYTIVYSALSSAKTD